MEIRQAILKTADLFEAKPGEFAFHKVDIPRGIGCGTPGCVLGWIAFFMGTKTYEELPDGLDSVLNMWTRDFYNRMDEVIASDRWMCNATDCAKALRLYADAFHPESFPSIRQELDRIAGMGIEKSGTGIAA